MRFQGKNWGVLTLARKNRTTNEVMLSTAGAQSQSAVDTQEVEQSDGEKVMTEKKTVVVRRRKRKTPDVGLLTEASESAD